MKLLMVIVSIMLVASCSYMNADHKIIDKKSMVDVLVDIHIADAILGTSTLRVNRDSLEIESYYDDILKKHQVTQIQIDNSLKHYAKDIKEFEDIYLQVSEKLSKMESEYQKNALLNQENTKQDSIESSTSELE